MNNPSDYTITVRRFAEDDAHVFKATVKELPHVQGLGETYAEAYEMALEAIEGLQLMAIEDGALFPEPAQESTSEWSGRVTLRLPKSLHRSAVELAEDEGVSFNLFATTVIADAVARKSVITTTERPKKDLAYAALYHSTSRAETLQHWVAQGTNISEVYVVPPTNVRKRSLKTSLSSDPFFIYGLHGNG